MNSEMIYQKGFLEKDEIDSLYYQGVCYSFGYGVSKDLEKAKNTYKEGTENKNAKCMYGLAILLSKSKKRLNKNIAQRLFVEAFEDLYQQAKLGDPVSQRMISCYFLFGNRGVPQNLDDAKTWLLLAAENEDAEAQMNLAHCYETGNLFPLDLHLAHEWYVKAAAQGNCKACEKLGEMRSKEDE